MRWSPRRRHRHTRLLVMRIVKWRRRGGRWRFLIKAGWILPFASPRWKNSPDRMKGCAP